MKPPLPRGRARQSLDKAINASLPREHPTREMRQASHESTSAYSGSTRGFGLIPTTQSTNSKVPSVRLFHVIDRPLDRTTVLMPHDKNQFGSGHFASELHAAQEVFIDKVPSNTADKHIPNPLIEHVFHR